MGRLQKLAADPKKVTKAVDHALTSRRPKRRYLLDFVKSGPENRRRDHADRGQRRGPGSGDHIEITRPRRPLGHASPDDSRRALGRSHHPG